MTARSPCNLAPSPAGPPPPPSGGPGPRAPSRVCVPRNVPPQPIRRGGASSVSARPRAPRRATALSSRDAHGSFPAWPVAVNLPGALEVRSFARLHVRFLVPQGSDALRRRAP